MAWCVCESTKSTVEDFIQMKSNKIVKTGILTGSRLVWVFNSGCKSFFNLIREPVFYYLMIFHNGSNDKPVKYSNISLKLFELRLVLPDDYTMIVLLITYTFLVHHLSFLNVNRMPSVPLVWQLVQFQILNFDVGLLE